MKKPVILMILDGFGIAPEKGNAIKAAKKPNIDKLFASNPLTQIGASGMDVGLPDGQMGNSEVGHTNMGAAESFIRNSQELQRLSTRTSSKITRLLLMQWTRLSRTARHFTLWDFSQTAVFTATLSISTVFLNLLRKRVLKMFTFTHSLTAVMFRLQVPLNMLTSFLTSSKKSA